MAGAVVELKEQVCHYEECEYVSAFVHGESKVEQSLKTLDNLLINTGTAGDSKRRVLTM